MDLVEKNMNTYWQSDVVVYCTIILVVLVGYTSVFLYSLSAAHAHDVSTTHFLTFSEGDAHEYYVLGHVLHDSGRFSLAATSSPEYFRTPAYPFFIAVLLGIFKNDLAVPFAQFLLVALSALCIFRLGIRYFSREVGGVAAALYILDPMTITQSSRTTTETLFVFVLLSAVLILVQSELTPRKVVAGGVLLGVLALVRPIGLPVVAFFLLWVLIVHWREWKIALRQSLLFLFGVSVIVVPWLYRNYVNTQHFSLSSITAYNMLFYNVLEFEHQRTGVSKDILHSQMVTSIGSSDTDQQFRTFAYTDAEQKVIMEYVSPHFFQYALFHLSTTIPFLFGSDIEDSIRSLHLQGVLKGDPHIDVNISALLRQGKFDSFISTLMANPVVLVERIGWLVLVLSALGMVTVLVHTRSRKSLPILFLFVLPFVFALLTGPVSSPRYRMPVAPFLMLLGVAGLPFLINYWKNSRVQSIVKAPTT